MLKIPKIPSRVGQKPQIMTLYPYKHTFSAMQSILRHGEKICDIILCCTNIENLIPALKSLTLDFNFNFFFMVHTLNLLDVLPMLWHCTSLNDNGTSSKKEEVQVKVSAPKLNF